VTDVRLTRSSGDEKNLTIQAIADGITTIICVGGDGTSGNVATAILHSGADTRLGVIPAGTGNDFAKTLGTSRADFTEVARLAVGLSDDRMDVGRIDGGFFLNSCGFGFDVAVLQGLASGRMLRGNAVYLHAALRQLFSYPGITLTIGSSRIRRERITCLMLVIANCPHFGGAFVIAPSAVATDGELDAVIVANVGAGARVKLLAAATRGRHTSFAEVNIERASEFTVEFDEIPFYETDGEVHQASSPTVAVRCVPNALRVVADEGFQTRQTALGARGGAAR
jgi:diacylglycerol kinase (ATP)